MSREAALKAKVKAVNAAHKYAIELYPILAKIFEPFVGQKIEKAGGNLLAKIQKLLPELPYKGGLHVYQYHSNYSLAWCVKTCEQVEGAEHCLYYETTVYVGNMNNGVLAEISKPYSNRTDFTCEEIARKRQLYQDAQEKADDAKSDLHPFGEYER